MELPPSMFLIKETTPPLRAWCPTKKLTDCKSPQVCRMPLQKHAKTLLEEQVKQQLQQNLTSKAPMWLSLYIIVKITHEGFHFPTKGQT